MTLRKPTQRKPRPAEKHGRTVVIPAEVLERLEPHAQRRGITVNALARRIVAIAVDEGMVDAILDDGHEMEKAA